MSPQYHYVIVRSDLTIGQQAAHILHAAAESSQGLHDHETHAVVLTVPDLATLIQYLNKLEGAGIAHVYIDTTAIGLVPTRDRGPIKKILSSLPLLRSPQTVLKLEETPVDRGDVGQTNGEHQPIPLA